MDPSGLKNNPIFAALDAAELARLAALATEESYPVGSTLVREGDFSAELYVIEEGTADIVRDGEVLGQAGPGDIVGEIGVLEKSKRTASVIVTAPMLVTKITHWEIRRLSADTIARLQAVVATRAR